MKILAFGEILWDSFGDKKEIGGVPFNFAAHMSKLGAECSLITAIGRDRLGEAALECVREHGISDKYICLSDKPTGVCVITFEGEKPAYILIEDAAYDNIPKQRINDSFDALYMGTLAQRSKVSEAALSDLMTNIKAREVFFDINIRQNYYSKNILTRSLCYTSILKFSREEVFVFPLLGFTPSCRDLPGICNALSENFPLKKILVTLDNDGAMLFDCKTKEILYSDKPDVKAVSTVGAGDSFSACFLYNYLNGKDIKLCLNRAVKLGSYVVTKTGAVPDYSREFVKELTE